MNRQILGLGVLMAVVLCFEGTAHAEILEGRVISVDSSANTVRVSTTQGDVVVAIPPAARLQGVSGINDLKSGDNISFDANQDIGAGSWVASTLSRRSSIAGDSRVLVSGPGVSSSATDAGGAT